MTRATWAIWITCTVALTTAMSFAQSPDPKRDQAAAATARAVERLRVQIAAEPVGKGITIGDMLDATDGNDFLVKTLQRAQMIGGPRWIDDQTCQVRLEISGVRVAAALVQIDNLNPKKSPIAPDVLAGRLKQWENRTFSATATSTGAAAVDQVRPVDEGPAWAQVSDPSRQQAIAAAKKNAIADVIFVVGPIPIADGKTVGDALKDPHVHEAVDQWLASRPVTQVEFHQDLQVVVTLSTPARALADVFFEAAESTHPPVAALDDAAHDRIRELFHDRVASGSHGTARAGAVSVTQASLTLPATPPRWVNDQIDAEGSGSSRISQLKAARAAEADAQTQLRAKIDALPLADGLTLGDAARQDSRVADVIGRTISRTRASKVDYQPDGSARVRVGLELHDLWDALAAAM